jgi:hypothetical protein
VLYVIVGAGVVLTLGAVVPKVTGMGETFLTTRPSLIVCGMLFLVGGWALARDIGLEESLDRERRRADQLVKEADQARLLALRTHLDPHFLFNTLNAIAEWCREDGEVAERAVLQLSSMLRTILTGVRSATGRKPSPLDALRPPPPGPEPFTVMIDLAADARDLAVPPLVPSARRERRARPAAGIGRIAASPRAPGARQIRSRIRPLAVRGRERGRSIGRGAAPERVRLDAA